MNEQLDLFGGEPVQRLTLPTRVGDVDVAAVEVSAVLTRASGFMAAYDYTLNPYSGCAFGCSYCYAAFFSRSPELQQSWGHWVQAKVNAVDVVRRMRTRLQGKSVYMSSVTDPYQPIERRLGLVEELLPILAERGVRLVVQTRSPLVVRDIAAFRLFEAVRVNMTITTDSESVQRAFEPRCPTNRKRLAAIAEVHAAGIPTCITLTPLLPVEDPAVFARQLLETGVTRFVVQPFHAERGRFVAGTGDAALELVRQMGWDDAAYRATVDVLRSELPHLDEGQEGFAPA